MDGWVVTTEFFLVATKNEHNRESLVVTKVSVSRQRIVTGMGFSVATNPFFRDSV